jgi:hypothetical protein
LITIREREKCLDFESQSASLFLLTSDTLPANCAAFTKGDEILKKAPILRICQINPGEGAEIAIFLSLVQPVAGAHADFGVVKGRSGISGQELINGILESSVVEDIARTEFTEADEARTCDVFASVSLSQENADGQTSKVIAGKEAFRGEITEDVELGKLCGMTNDPFISKEIDAVGCLTLAALSLPVFPAF